MKRVLMMLLLSFTLSACGSLSAFILENRKNLARLSYGMTKEQVTAVMGEKTVRSFNNPYRTAMFTSREGVPVEVFYYWTDGSAKRGITDDQLTPVVFNNGTVVGWGREFWYDYSQKIDLTVRKK